MEELLSGHPDDDPADDRPYLPPAGVATLDLTGDGAEPASEGRATHGSVLKIRVPLVVAPPVPPPARIPFGQFVTEEAGRLLGTAYLLTGDRRVAEKLLRQALADAAAGWPQLATDPMTGVLRGLVRPVTGRLWWGRTPRPLVDAVLPGVLGAGLSALPPRQRAGLVLRYHQRITEEEAAAALRAPAGNVRTWISRALDLLGIDPGLDLRPRSGAGLSRSGLSAALEALAEPHRLAEPRPEDDEPRRQELLDDVARRLPALRRQAGRRRLVGRLAIGAAVVAAIAGALIVASASAPARPSPPEPAPLASSPARDAVDQAADWSRFEPDLGGDPLLVGMVGAEGQDTLVVRFSPSTTNLAFTGFCRTDYGGGLAVIGTLNGHVLLTGSCSGDERANGSTISRDDYPTVDRSGWWREGVRPRQESVLRFRLVNAEGRPQAGTQVRLGVAVYQLTGPRVVSQGVIIKRVVDDDEGRDFRLGGYRTAKIGQARKALALDVPAGSDPALVMVGMPGSTSESYEPMPVRVDGGPADRRQSLGTYTFPLEDAGAHRLSIRPRPDDTGVMLLAWYRAE